jgi:hypothetical protein
MTASTVRDANPQDFIKEKKGQDSTSERLEESDPSHSRWGG